MPTYRVGLDTTNQIQVVSTAAIGPHGPAGPAGADGVDGQDGQGVATAADVPIVDLDGLFTATETEGALTEAMQAIRGLLDIVAQVAVGKGMLFGDNSAVEFDLAHGLGSEYPVVTIFDVDTGMVVIDNEGHATDSDTWHVGPLETIYGVEKLRASIVVPPS